MIELIGYGCVALVLIVVGLVIAFEKGLIGLTPERIAEIHAKADALQEKLEAKLAKKAKPAKVAPTLAPAAPAGNEALKANIHAQLLAGQITPDQAVTLLRLIG